MTDAEAGGKKRILIADDDRGQVGFWFIDELKHKTRAVSLS